MPSQNRNSLMKAKKPKTKKSGAIATDRSDRLVRNMRRQDARRSSRLRNFRGIKEKKGKNKKNRRRSPGARRSGQCRQNKPDRQPRTGTDDAIGSGLLGWFATPWFSRQAWRPAHSTRPVQDREKRRRSSTEVQARRSFHVSGRSSYPPEKGYIKFFARKAKMEESPTNRPPRSGKKKKKKLIEICRIC